MFRQKPQGKAPLKGGEIVQLQENLSPLERITKLGSATLALQRLVCVHELVDTSHEIGYDLTLSHLLPLVQNLASDSEVLVRQELVKHFGDLAGFLIQSDPEQGYSKVVEFLLPILEVFLIEKASDVREGAEDALIVLASHLQTARMGEHVLKIIIGLSHNCEDEDARSTAVLLLNSVAETFGKDDCQQVVAVTFLALCEDPQFRVRKATATYFAEVAKNVDGEAVLGRLIQQFGKLICDQHWGVRKVAAESLVGVAQAVKAETCEKYLVKMMFDLLKDNSRWVRTAGLQELGYFIAVLGTPKRVPIELLTQYVEIIEQTKSNPDTADISYHCAFSFAAVTRTMGKESWSKLQAPFESLCQDTHLRTRKAMAASIHIVAETLGSDVIDEEVLPHFEALLMDTCDEVRHAAMKNVASILRLTLMPASQKRVLKAWEIKATGAGNNWRLRHLAASQLGSICEALGKSSASEEGSISKEELTWSLLVPLLLKLCQDSVAEVRDEAAEITAIVLRAAAPESFADQNAFGTEGSSGCSSGETPELPPKTTNLVRHLIRVFARGRSFRHRMTYIRMCGSVIRDLPPNNVFTERFLKPLARLSTDRVKNVRLCWATKMSWHFGRNRLGQSHAVLAAAHKMAKEDTDKEVLRILANARIPALPEDADVSLGPDSDLDESGSEGGTGESSECSEVAAGEDMSDSVDPVDTTELPTSSSSSSGTSNEPVLEDTKESSATSPPSSQSELSPEPPPSPTDQRSPSGSSSSSPVQNLEYKSQKLGSNESVTVVGVLSFDRVEDCLVDQREVERDMDETFADRRLFHEAETDAPELKAEKVAPLVSSSEFAQRLQAQQEMVDSKFSAVVVESAMSIDASVTVTSVEDCGKTEELNGKEDPQKIDGASIVTMKEPREVTSTDNAPVVVESAMPVDASVTTSVEDCGPIVVTTRNENDENDRPSGKHAKRRDVRDAVH